MMLLLPLLFVIFIINFPAGSILYWITTNTWTMGQQRVIRRRIGPGVPAANTVQALDSRRAPRQLDCPIGVLRSQTRDGMGVAGSESKRARPGTRSVGPWGMLRVVRDALEPATVSCNPSDIS